MLFHLKEPDYKTEALNDITTRFYGRTSEQILACLDYYNERNRKKGNVGNPNLTWWAKKKFSETDIEEVEKGEFYFFAGMISFADKDMNKPLFEEIKVCDDFNVYVPEDNLGSFAIWRTSITRLERGGLYKLQNPIEMFYNLSFVPEDIAKAIVNCDLTPYREAVKKDESRRAELSRHHNIKVGLSEKVDEDKLKAITLFPKDYKSL